MGTKDCLLILLQLSLTRMKLFNAIAAFAIFSTSVTSANPAEAGRLYSLKYNVGISKNDGNPRFVVTDGSRMIIVLDEGNRNPLKGEGYGYIKSYSVSRQQAASIANVLHRNRNCVDTLNISLDSNIGQLYETAMFMTC